MLPALATIGAAALAASTVLVPVTQPGEAGWFDISGMQGDYSIDFEGDGVTFSTEAAAPDMKLAKLGAGSLEELTALADTEDGISMEGDNAHLAFRAYVDKPGSLLPKYTAIVWAQDNPDHVWLTWGSSQSEEITVDEFVERGYTGLVYQVEVGYTDTSSSTGATATVNSVTIGDTEFDFGTGADDAPGMPGKGNENGLGNGNGNGNPPAHGHDKDKNKA